MWATIHQPARGSTRERGSPGMAVCRGLVGLAMTSIATEARPAIIGAFLLTLALWLECDPSRSSLCAALEPIPPPPFLALPSTPGHVYSPGGILRPDWHPDARDWPVGMVIRPQATHDRIQVELASAVTPLDMLLSALLGPWFAPAS